MCLTDFLGAVERSGNTKTMLRNAFGSGVFDMHTNQYGQATVELKMLHGEQPVGQRGDPRVGPERRGQRAAPRPAVVGHDKASACSRRHASQRPKCWHACRDGRAEEAAVMTVDEIGQALQAWTPIHLNLLGAGVRTLWAALPCAAPSVGQDARWRALPS